MVRIPPAPRCTLAAESLGVRRPRHPAALCLVFAHLLCAGLCSARLAWELHAGLELQARELLLQAAQTTPGACDTPSAGSWRPLQGRQQPLSSESYTQAATASNADSPWRWPGGRVGLCELPRNWVATDEEGGLGGTCILRGCVPKKV